MKVEMKSFGVALFFVFGWQGAVFAFEPSAPPLEEGETVIPFQALFMPEPSAPPLEEEETVIPLEKLFIMVSDIENGLETFGGKLPYIRSKNQKVFSALLDRWNQEKNPVGAIDRASATSTVNDRYNETAYMQCADIDKPVSPFYNKLIFIKDKDVDAYNRVIAELQGDKYCINGLIVREAIDARVHAVYIRVYAAWVSAASFYYAKSFAQTTYSFITTALIPAIAYVFSNGYGYVKKYGAQVLEKNRQRKKSAEIRIKQRPAVEQAPVFEPAVPSFKIPVQSRTISRPDSVHKRRFFNPNA